MDGVLTWVVLSSIMIPNLKPRISIKVQQWFERANKATSYGKESCQICGRTNHTAITCYYRYDYTTKMENTQEALVVMNLNGNNDSRFYVDLGAMAHMTNQGDKLKL